MSGIAPTSLAVYFGFVGCFAHSGTVGSVSSIGCVSMYVPTASAIFSSDTPEPPELSGIVTVTAPEPSYSAVIAPANVSFCGFGSLSGISVVFAYPLSFFSSDSFVGTIIASINDFSSLPCFADKGLFVLFDVRLLIISDTSTLLVSMPLIRDLLYLI